MDDMVITGNDEDKITKLKKKLPEEFDLKDLEKLRYFLGVEFARSKKGSIISHCLLPLKQTINSTSRIEVF